MAEGGGEALGQYLDARPDSSRRIQSEVGAMSLLRRDLDADDGGPSPQQEASSGSRLMDLANQL